MNVQRDTLFLLKPDFVDPAYPGQRFYCWHCALLEGVLASFPEALKRLDVVRIAWPRPRREVVALIGEENQSLPVLILGGDTSNVRRVSRHGPIAFVNNKDSILDALSVRYGIASPHP